MANLQKTSDALLIIIARAPVVGATKTRLGASIGMGRAAILHRAFVTDLAARFSPYRDRPAELGYDLAWSWGPATFAFDLFLHQCNPTLADRTYHLLPQIEDTFAARLTDLFVRANTLGYSRVQIMASDSPHLPVDWLARGFELLTTHDVSIGRVEDGGYYVVGMNGVHQVLSPDVMSTASAADDLVACAQGKGLSVAELPASFDVDSIQDLRQLIDLLSRDRDCAPATWQALVDTYLINPLSHPVDMEIGSQSAP
jgi:glycosyltransferase A (GT-A) superfamily protein (DUF2064 family)